MIRCKLPLISKAILCNTPNTNYIHQDSFCFYESLKWGSKTSSSHLKTFCLLSLYGGVPTLASATKALSLVTTKTLEEWRGWPIFAMIFFVVSVKSPKHMWRPQSVYLLVVEDHSTSQCFGSWKIPRVFSNLPSNASFNCLKPNKLANYSINIYLLYRCQETHNLPHLDKH